MFGCLLERLVRPRQSSEMAFEHHGSRNLNHFRQIRDRLSDALDGADAHSFRFDDQVDGPGDRKDRDDAGSFAQLGDELRAGSAWLVLDEEMGRGSPSKALPSTVVNPRITSDFNNLCNPFLGGTAGQTDIPDQRHKPATRILAQRRQHYRVLFVHPMSKFPHGAGR